MSMKRITALLAAAVMSISMLTACGNGEADNNSVQEGSDATTKMPAPGEVAEQLLSGVTFEQELSQLTDEEITFYITVEDGVDGVMYMSSGSTAEEIAVFEAPDKNVAAAMLSNAKDFLSDQRSSFEDYIPEEAKRIDDAVVEQKGNYVVICVSGDSATAKSVIEQAFGE